MPLPSDTAAGPVLVPPFVVHTRKGGHGGHSLESAWRQAKDHRADPRFYITDSARRRFTADEFLAACAVLTAPPSPQPAGSTTSVVVTTNQPGVATPTALTVWPPGAAAGGPPPEAPAEPAADEEEIDLAVELPPMALPLRVAPAAEPAGESPFADDADAVAAGEASASQRQRPLTGRYTERLRRTSAQLKAEAEPTEVIDRSRQMTVIGLVAVALGIALAGWWLAGSGPSRRSGAPAPGGTASTEPIFASEPQPQQPPATAKPTKPPAAAKPPPKPPPKPAPPAGRSLPQTTQPDDGGPPVVADLAAALVAHWTFDDDDDPTRAVDATGRAHDLAISGATRVPGRSGRALHFDAAGSATAAGLKGFDAPEVTVMAWVRIPAKQKGEVSLLRHDGRFTLQLGEMLRVVGWRPGVEGFLRAEAPWKPQYTDGAWHHLAVSCRRDEVRIFRDGQVHARRSLPGSGLRPSNAPFLIGATERGAERLIGDIDEVRLYRAALADAQIAAIAAATPPLEVPAPAPAGPAAVPPAPAPPAAPATPAVPVVEPSPPPAVSAVPLAEPSARPAPGADAAPQSPTSPVPAPRVEPTPEAAVP